MTMSRCLEAIPAVQIHQPTQSSVLKPQCDDRIGLQDRVPRRHWASHGGPASGHFCPSISAYKPARFVGAGLAVSVLHNSGRQSFLLVASTAAHAPVVLIPSVMKKETILMAVAIRRGSLGKWSRSGSPLSKGLKDGEEEDFVSW